MTAKPLGPVAANLICVVSILMWSAGLPASHYLIPLLPPLSLSGARMTLAALTLLPLWLLIEGAGALRASAIRAGEIHGRFVPGVLFTNFCLRRSQCRLRSADRRIIGFRCGKPALQGIGF